MSRCSPGAATVVLLCSVMPSVSTRVPRNRWFPTVASPLLLLVLAVGDATAQTIPAICAIDMGSNSFRRIVGSYEGGRYVQQSIEVLTLGVGDDVARHGRITDAKLAEIAAALAAFRASCEKGRAAPVVAIGTAAFRQASNGQRVVDLAAKLGISMEIASERRESELAYLVGSLGRDEHAVIDNGSRSIELVSKRGGVLRHQVLNLGYRAAYETFFADATDPAAAIGAFRNQLRQHTSKAAFMKGMKALVGVEFGEMANALFEPAAVEGRVFTLAQLKQKLDDIARAPGAEFEALKKRGDIDRAVPRLVVAATLTEDFGYSEFQLTERELGVGLIIESRMRPRAPR
jgi:exopolyphosphatase/pppGpp-phosphohydrolase